MGRNRQKAELFDNERTAHGVCLLLFEQYCESTGSGGIAQFEIAHCVI